MTLDWAMLAEAVQLRDGLAFVLAGGIDTVTVDQVPAPFTAAVLIRLLLHRTEVDHPHVLEIRLLDEDGKQLLAMHGQVHPQAPEDLPIGWDVPMMATFAVQGFPLPQPGRYSVEILIDGTHHKSLNLRVRLRQPAPAVS